MQYEKVYSIFLSCHCIERDHSIAVSLPANYISWFWCFFKNWRRYFYHTDCGTSCIAFLGLIDFTCFIENAEGNFRVFE